MNKAGIANRLSKAGLRNVAEAYREEVRRRIAQAQGGKTRDRDSVSAAAWQEMWDTFRPVVERREEQQAEGANEPDLAGCAADLDDLLDPEYTETDPGKWLRDGLIWAAAEIRRVVIDSDEGTTVDLTRAKSPPPTAWAVFCVETFARKKPSQRGELIGKVLPFATRSHDVLDGEGQHQESGGFLDTLD